MKAFSNKILFLLLPFLASRLILLIYWLGRPEKVNFPVLEELFSSGQHVIFSAWHDQLLLIPPSLKRLPITALISASKDGELVARTFAYFAVGAVRGSSNKGGRQALRELKALASEPVHIAITPDGPKGPRHVAKYGVVQLSKVSGRPIVPIAFACSHGYRFKSWDKFILPYPWGKSVYHVGQPQYPDKKETTEDFLLRVQGAMDENLRQAMEYLKKYDLSAI